MAPLSAEIITAWALVAGAVVAAGALVLAIKKRDDDRTERRFDGLKSSIDGLYRMYEDDRKICDQRRQADEQRRQEGRRADEQRRQEGRRADEQRRQGRYPPLGSHFDLQKQWHFVWSVHTSQPGAACPVLGCHM